MKKQRQKINSNSDSDSTAASCSDKLGFDTSKQATAAKVVADLQHGASLKTYRCTKCRLWHLTSSY